MALDYLNKNLAAPGTMPTAVPAGPSPELLAAIQPQASELTPAQSAAISAPMPGAMPLPPLALPKAQYQAVTQDDESILIHMVNADGSLGPAVKIIPPIKKKQQPV